MRVLISSTYIFDNAEELVAEYPFLKDFEFESVVTKRFSATYGHKKIEKVIAKTYITINTLEDLISIMDKSGHDLVLIRDGEKGRISEIEIYDGYRE